MPATFLERGVKVPFTAAALCSARVRPAARTGLELLVPNLFGGRGVFVVPLQTARETCAPTVHDAKLLDRLCAMRNITPRDIQRVSREIACEGWAGDGATAAVDRAVKAERFADLLTNFELLLKLIKQVDPNGSPVAFSAAGDAAEIETRIKAALEEVAPKLGKDRATIAGELEEIASLLSGVGVGLSVEHARVPRGVVAVKSLRDSLVAWAASANDDNRLIAEFAAGAAEMTLTCVAPTLRTARAQAADVSALLARWKADPVTVADQLTRPDWVIDGWEPICALWRGAETDAQRCCAIAEIATLVPAMPREATQWAGLPLDWKKPPSLRRAVRINEDWRTGDKIIGIVERNEQLRALAA
ncbi:MAG: hypothetical protein JOY70_05675 [Acidisphaera sp.]|nr:hypothetical protein [Acidisphaera sp.]